MEKYSKYKDSGIEWIGEIPEHWEVKPVKLNFKFTTGFTPPTGKTEYYENGKYVWINISDLKGKYISDSQNKITEKALEKFTPKIVKKGSLLYSFKLSVGRVGFVTKDCYTNEAIFSIEPEENTNLNFFYYSLPEQIINNSNENIYGAKILNQELIKNAFLVVPPPTEQTAIANYLDKKTAELDHLISEKKQLVKLYQEEKTAIINQAVTKGINPNAKLKDSGIEWLGDIPKHWEVKKLKYVVSKVGSGVTPSGGSTVYKKEGIPLLRSQNVYSEGFKLNNVVFITDEVHDKMNNSKVYKNDVLLNITGASIGRVFYVKDEFDEANVNQHVCIIRPNLNLIKSKFLYYLIRSEIGQNQILIEQTGSNREGLNFVALKNFDMPFISLNEQTQIVDFIEQENKRIDAKIKKAKKYINLLTEYRTSLISEVVTGKIKVID